MKNEKGFSLIELLIVVAIIGIIAAIAIPNLLKSRQAANESSAIGSVRTIGTAQATYQLTTGKGKHFAGAGGDALLVLSDATQGHIDATLGAGAKSGYTFTCVGVDATATTASYFDTLGNPQSNGHVRHGPARILLERNLCDLRNGPGCDRGSRGLPGSRTWFGDPLE